MILLLGGTSDTAPLAGKLVEQGFKVLVSLATDEPLAVGRCAEVSVRRGRLCRQELEQLIVDQAVKIVVDATHPYAVEVRVNAEAAAHASGCPYLTYIRPSGIPKGTKFHSATTHEEAAKLAFSFGKTVLLTTGSNNLDDYVRESEKAAVAYFSRVIPRAESLEACRRAGVPDFAVIALKGPFSVAENRRMIQKCNAGVLVAKDSGSAGGLETRIRAAKLEDCELVIINRPQNSSEFAFSTYDDLVNKAIELATWRTI